ncbi:hypothetical protein WH357_21285 [Enterobacter ludwigii]
MSEVITEQNLSLADKGLADKLKDIMAAKYGVIAINEPVLHAAVANAAALNYLIAELNKHHQSQRDDMYLAQQTFRDNLSDTLGFFEKNLMTTIQKATAETCERHIEQFRVISEKQTGQIRYLIENDMDALLNKYHHRPTETSAPSSHYNWLFAGVAGGVLVSLLTYLII